MATPKSTAAVIAVVALFLASVAAYLVYDYFHKQEAQMQARSMQIQPIVVAAEDIPYGSRIQDKQIKLADWPKSNLPAGYSVNVNDIKNRISVATIPAGSPILEAELAPPEAQGGVLSYIVPPGMRAITVAVNEVVGVAGFVLPNSIVDVVATANSPYKTGRDSRISKIILQSIKVLAVGQILDQKEGKPVVVPTVTLEVTPHQAETLALASENKVQLILRHLGDTAEVKTGGATITSMLGGATPHAPSARPARGRARAAASTQTGEKVEVIKGSVKTEQEFK